MRIRSLRRAAVVLTTSLLTAGVIDVQPAMAATKHWSVPLRKLSVQFQDVATYSAKSRWAVGSQQVRVADGIETRPLVERWNGKRWHIFRAPAMPKGASSASLRRVVVRTPRDVWVVGEAEASIQRDFVAHWNGRRWSEHVLPKNVTVAHLGVMGKASTWVLAEAWADNRMTGRYYHWNGRRWRTGGLPSVPEYEPSSSAPADWARSFDFTAQKTRLLRLIGNRWRVVRAPKVTLPAHTTDYWINDLVPTAHAFYLTVGFSFHDGQGPGLAIYRKTRAGWKRVAFLKDESPIGGAVRDRRDGLWIMSSFGSAHLLHVVDGKVTRRASPPVRHGVRMQIAHISAGPRDASIYAVGDFLEQRGDQQFDFGAVARFIP